MDIKYLAYLQKCGKIGQNCDITAINKMCIVINKDVNQFKRVGPKFDLIDTLMYNVNHFY